MQTTLRIDDHLNREIKAKAARAGVSLTRFLEEGLRLRLEKKMISPTAPHAFRTYAAEEADPRTWDQIRQVADESSEAHDLAKLDLHARQS